MGFTVRKTVDETIVRPTKEKISRYRDSMAVEPMARAQTGSVYSPSNVVHGLQFRPIDGQHALSPFKMEWSLQARARESKHMVARHPDRVPIVVERGPERDVPELPKSKLLLPNTLTVAQALRIIRTKAGLGHDSKLQLFVRGGRRLDHHLVLAAVHARERDEDGFLYCTYCIDQQASRRRSKSSGREDKADAREENTWFSWAPTSGFSWTPSGGWSVAPKEEVQGRELVEMFSKKEQRARKRFQTRMRKRAAGPREEPQVVSNTKLASALASCKLDTALSGMMQVASKSSSATVSPGSSQSAYKCGMPCALRVHTVLAQAGAA